jgi:acylphosphatase
MLHALIYGRVQGVYYRDFVRRHAQRLGLTGWVRNLRDRSVEVQAEGDQEHLAQLLDELKNGPPGARVDDIKNEWLDFTGRFSEFSVTD